MFALAHDAMQTFLESEWRYLAMAHYRVEPALLSRFLPAETELDEWNGQTFVSLIGFRFVDTRVLGLAVPFHRDFDEINLRLYVRRHENGELRRGVVFIKEVVSLPAVAAAARVAFNERYVVHRTRSRIPRTSGANPGRLLYEWRSESGWNSIDMAAGDGPFLASPGSREQFFTERPWGYTVQKDGGTLEYRVDHPPWRMWRAKSAVVRCHAAELYGAEFAPVLDEDPDLCCIAEGSPVMVSRPWRIG